MNKKLLIYSTFCIEQENLTIREVATLIISLLWELKANNKLFTTFSVIGDSSDTVFDLINTEKEEVILDLSETILKAEKSDIRKYDREKNPTIDFSRSIGFVVGLLFEKKDDYRFIINFSVGGVSKGIITFRNFPVNEQGTNFDVFYEIFKTCNLSLNPLYSNVGLKHSKFFNEASKLPTKLSLGWITYFSTKSDIIVPENFGLEVIEEKLGYYLIATRDDIIVDTNKLLATGDMLYEKIVELMEYCPAYIEKR